jgi:UDP-N-acetylglucosamine 1-carboxyvinyltransferase
MGLDKIIIDGGRKLSGCIDISGSKNAALPILIATLLTDDKCMLHNVPNLQDINTCISIIEHFGKKTYKTGHSIEIVSSGKVPLIGPYELIKKMRASFLITGPLLARYGKIKAALPGGCAIGVRPVNIHLDGFIKLGAQAELNGGYVTLSAKKMSAAHVNLSFPSVGATENLIMCAALVDGETVISNAAREPEITDLADFLNKLGGDVTGAGTSVITVKGTKKLHGAEHSVIPDRIEAGTYLIAGAITKSNITINKCVPEHIRVIIENLEKAGCKISCTADSVCLRQTARIKPVSIVTEPYPGFPTDLQAQWMVLMCLSAGSSVIKETVFENRFMHVGELQRLGANLEIKDDFVVVTGGSRLSGAPVMVSDLRAGAALVLAGLAAKGKTVITHIYHLDRGYENLEHKLEKLNAKIRRVRVK